MPDPNPKAAPKNAPPANDPNDIDGLKKQLDDAKAKIADATTTANNLTAQIKVAQARIDEVKKVTDAFGAAVAAQEKDLGTYQQQIAQKSTMVKAAVPQDQVNAINDVVTKVDADIKAKTDQVAKLQQEMKKAQDALDAATADAMAKLDAYTVVQGTQKDTDAQLKSIKDWLTSASTAELAGDLVTMYYLVVNVAAPAADKVTILSADNYAAKLKAAQADNETAKKTQADKQAARDAAASDLKGAQSALSDAATARPKAILDQLKTIGTAPAAPAPPAPPASAPAAPDGSAEAPAKV